MGCSRRFARPRLSPFAGHPHSLCGGASTGVSQQADGRRASDSESYQIWYDSKNHALPRADLARIGNHGPRSSSLLVVGYAVAIDAGTTGVRALVVDEQARVVDTAYREITQYFPRPGWVEHDPVEIWDGVCATRAEVGGRLAEAGGTVAAIGITNQRETLVAFDRSNGRPLHRAIVWQDRRTADICAALERDGHLPMVRERTGLILDPYFTATKITWLLRRGDLALSAGDPDLAFGTVDSWLHSAAAVWARHRRSASIVVRLQRVAGARQLSDPARLARFD